MTESFSAAKRYAKASTREPSPSSDQMTALLWLVGEWSIRGGDGVRAEVALEALKEFRYEPLSLMEVYALMQDAGRCREELHQMSPAEFLNHSRFHENKP